MPDEPMAPDVGGAEADAETCGCLEVNTEAGSELAGFADVLPRLEAPLLLVLPPLAPPSPPPRLPAVRFRLFLPATGGLAKAES